MSDQPVIPAPTRTTGLSPAQQKLQALREKAARSKVGGTPAPNASSASFKARNTFNGKKTNFQRKAT